METVLVEILAGDGIETAFKELGIEAKCTYKQTKTPHYEVWEIAEDDMFMMDLVSNWPDRYGWWTYSEGSNMGSVNHDITINGKAVTAWMRDGLMDDLRRDWERETKKNKEIYDFDFAKYAEDNIFTDYHNLLEYFCDHLGASKASNVFALAKDLAKYNKMTIAELFKTYQG